MKRKILFAILCIGVVSICSIVYASFIQTADTSILSDREMKHILGKCSTCYEYSDPYCRWYGSPECATGSCPSMTEIETDNWIPSYHTDGPPNGMKESSIGYIECYQNHWISSGDADEDYICDTDDPIPESEEDDWSDYWYSCSSDPGETCQRCSEGEAVGGTLLKQAYVCVPE